MVRLVQGEFRRNTKDGSSSKTNEKEDCALDGMEKKAKGKKSQGELGKKYLSKIRFFHSQNHGHYASNCPQKKERKKEPVVVAGEALASQFELDFTLISCMVDTLMGLMWYLDSGASFHMTSNKNLFNDLEEKDLQRNIECGDEGRYNVTGIGTITFQREYGSPLRLADVLYVPGLMRNLVSIALLEDRGYDDIFRKGKVFLRHIAMGNISM